jgi:hypothetical protein
VVAHTGRRTLTISVNNLETEVNKTYDAVRESLLDANIPLESIAIPLKEGTKEPIGKWKDESKRVSLSQAPQNYAVYPEGDLVFVDIDDREQAPEKLLNNTQSTFAVDSAHSGNEHRWITVPGDLGFSYKKYDWGEIRNENAYVVGPGTKVTECKKHEDCYISEENPGAYTLKKRYNIQRVDENDLEEWVGGFEIDTSKTTQTNQSVDLGDIPEIETDKVDYANACLREFQQQHPKFFTCLMDRLNGGRGEMGHSLNKSGSSKINRSKADYINLKDLYGVMLTAGESEERAGVLSHTLYTHYAAETPYHKDGQPRKWIVRGERDYQRYIQQYALEQFSLPDFQRNVSSYSSSQGRTRRANNRQSATTENYCIFACELLSGEYDGFDTDELYLAAQLHDLFFENQKLESVTTTNCLVNGNPPCGPNREEEKYPTGTDIYELAEFLNPNPRSEKSHRNAISDLVGMGQLKKAKCWSRPNGERYVYYPTHLPDPEDADIIEYAGNECLECDETMLYDTNQEEHYCPSCETEEERSIFDY